MRRLATFGLSHSTTIDNQSPGDEISTSLHCETVRYESLRMGYGGDKNSDVYRELPHFRSKLQGNIVGR